MDIRKLVRRAERDPWNRLNSIFEDADWVNSFCKSKIPHLPVIPNLRCGAWYVPDGLDKGCYFKSTDGHTTQWDFSLKRYNLDLVYLIQEKGGCAIVDSTRRGKSMSDALSKTIPIWCAVLNAASNHRHGKPQPCLFRLSQYVVSPSEEAQISAKIDGWVEMLLDSDLDVPLLEKPLQPLFVTRARHDEGINSLCAASTPDFYPIVLVSASQMVPTPGLEPMQSPIRKSSLNLSREIEILRQKSQYIYVQGSGDDEEMWSFHLTPSMFWNPAHLQRILSIGHGNNLEDTLRNIVLESKSKGLVDGKGGDIECNGFNIFLGTRHHTHIFSTLERQSYALIVHCDGPKNVSAEGEGGKEEEVGGHVIRLGIPLGKKGRAAFRDAIPLVVVSRYNAQKGTLP